MMKKSLTLFVFLSAIVPTTTFADLENWYSYWAIGLASHDYPYELDAAIDYVDSLPGIERTQSGFDLLGFYWPVDNTTMAGFVISGSADRLKDNYYGDYIQINQYLYGLSGMKFFGREIGEGFFIRGDIGLAKLVLSSNYSTDLSSDNGSGILLGAGFGLPISGQTRILFSVNFSSKTVEGEKYKSTTLNIGGLW